MNRILFSILLITSFVFSDYLQKGLYPDCSYVIVTDDGWKIHKNGEGRILSMIPKDKHDFKTGKYSFDKFGDLIPYIPCNNDSNDFYTKKISNQKTERDIEVSLNFSEIFKFKKPTFSIRGGASMPLGGNINPPYAMGGNYGLDLNFEKLSISMIGMMVPHDDGNSASLNSNGIFLGYKLKRGNLFIEPGVGMLSQEAIPLGSVDVVKGSDIGLKIDLGLDVGKKKKVSLYLQTIYTPTSYLGSEQTSTFYNFGMKYNI